MRIFDCTLRDGANVVGNGFSPELTESMIRGLLGCGIQDIEMGNAKGIGSYDRGAEAPLDDESYAKLASRYADKGRLGMFMLAAFADADKIKMVKDNGLDFIRVGTAAGDGAKAVEAVKMVKAAGLTCRYSMMKAYICPPEQLADEAKMLAEAGVDIITIMDSAGTMYPHETTAYVKALKEKAGIPVGSRSQQSGPFAGQCAGSGGSRRGRSGWWSAGYGPQRRQLCYGAGCGYALPSGTA